MNITIENHKNIFPKMKREQPKEAVKIIETAGKDQIENQKSP